MSSKPVATLMIVLGLAALSNVGASGKESTSGQICGKNATVGSDAKLAIYLDANGQALYAENLSCLTKKRTIKKLNITDADSCLTPPCQQMSYLGGTRCMCP